MKAASPTFAGILRGPNPQENAALTPCTPLMTGVSHGQQAGQLYLHGDKKRRSPLDESRRSRYEEVDSQGSRVEEQRGSLPENTNAEQSAADFSGKPSILKGLARAPFLPADHADPNELSNELEDIIMQRKIKENQERYGLLPAVKNAPMNRTIHNEEELFDLIGTDDVGSSRETLDLKNQLRMLKNLNLKEKLHYQRLIANNTRNKNFNLTQNNPGNQWLRANMTATTGFGVETDSLGLPSTRKKGKKDKMTFRLRKLSEINNEERKAGPKAALPERRMSLYTELPDKRLEEQFDLKSVDSNDDGPRRSLLPDPRHAGFNKTVQVVNAGRNA